MDRTKPDELRLWFDQFLECVLEEWSEFMARHGYVLVATLKDPQLLATYFGRDEHLVEIAIPIPERLVDVRFVTYPLGGSVSDEDINRMFLSPNLYLASILASRNVNEPEMRSGKFYMPSVKLGSKKSVSSAVRRMRDLTARYASDVLDKGV